MKYDWQHDGDNTTATNNHKNVEILAITPDPFNETPSSGGSIFLSDFCCICVLFRRMVAAQTLLSDESECSSKRVTE